MELILNYANIDPATAVNKICYNYELELWANYYDIDEDRFCLVIEPFFEDSEVDEDFIISLFEPYIAQ